LFAGFGGFTTGATLAGVDVVWAANHWRAAVDWHSVNHPETQHACQDLHQADWSQVPAHDLLLASPCCQGHSKARGKGHGNPEHDASRSTAWAVISAIEYHRPAFALIENVPEFMRWALFPAWSQAMSALGYSLNPHIVDVADLGVPQHRTRLFLVASRSRHAIQLQLPKLPHRAADTFIDWEAGRWSPIRKPRRAKATLRRVFNGRRALRSSRFLIPFYGSGSGLTGRSVQRPIGTITTVDRWALVKGEQMRMLSADEVMAAMSFPMTTKRPDSHRLTVHMAGNAVPPEAARHIITALQRAA
jgi:DNA (cytosine-5)-methyltransferase 1